MRANRRGGRFRGMRRLVPAIVVASLGLVGQQAQPVGEISGIVNDADGNPLPGARVQGTTEGYSIIDYSGPDGSFAFREVPVGVFIVRAWLAGFCQPPPRRVDVEADRVTRVDFSLELAAPDTVDRVRLSLAKMLDVAVAVAHVRIARSYPARLIVPNITCGDGNILTEHEADILAEIKVDDDVGPRARRLLFVQRRAGAYTEGDRSVEGPERPHVLGDEFVAFLGWRDEERYLDPHWEPWQLVPIRDGVVAWEGAPEIDEIPDAMPLETLLDLLRNVRSQASLR